MPFGEKWQSAAANEGDMGFTGHVNDATGLTYMQARFYDPVTGRFLSVDPVGFTPDQPFMFNRFAYVGNDPVNAIDPFGFEKRTVSRPIVTTGSRARKNYSVTVEAGSLTQAQTESVFSEVGDQFFKDQNGKDISGFGKSVSGTDSEYNDYARVASQVVGAQINARGGAAIKVAWGKVRSIRAIPNTYGNFASICALQSGCGTLRNGRSYGDMTLNNGGLSLKNTRDSWNLPANIFSTILHETLHLSIDYSTRQGEPGYAQEHKRLNQRSYNLSKAWGLIK